MSHPPAALDPVPVQAWEAAYGPIPDDYTCVDTETSGLDVRTDYVLQLGWCVVRGRTARIERDVLIDWTRVLAGGALADLAARIEKTRSRMAARGKQYGWTVDLLRARGVSPAEAIDRLTADAGPDPAFVAHYGVRYDYPVIGRFAAEFAGREFAPHVDRLFDTGVLTKAVLIGARPRAGESALEYLTRVAAVVRSPRHGIEACLDLFGLVAQGAVKAAAHSAAYDSWLAHRILEGLRALTTQRRIV